MIPVTVAPIAFQPDAGREHITVTEGVTVEEIVAIALPGAVPAVLERARVALVTDRATAIVPRAVWSRVRPHAGVHVVIRVLPGKDGLLRSVLTVLVAIAANWMAGFFAPMLVSATSPLFGAVKGLLTVGLTALGGLLLNKLLPPAGPERADRPEWAITGFRNRFAPDEPVPLGYGRMRYAPPYLVASYIEVVNGKLYARAGFVFRIGRANVSSLKIGDTPMSKFRNVQTELRSGLPGDAPFGLLPHQIVSEDVGADMECLYPRNDEGEPIDGPLEEHPVIRVTGDDAAAMINIFAFEAGLGQIDGNNKKGSHSVTFRRRIRPAGSELWTGIADWIVTDKKFATLYRSDRIDFPARGMWEVEYTRATRSEQLPSEKWTAVFACKWVVAQTFRPEYPINLPGPFCGLAVRMLATGQLNGQLDTLNAIVAPVLKDWDGEAWIERETSNPSSAGIDALQGPGLYRKVPDDEIDWPAFEDWHDFCVLKGLKFDRVYDQDHSLRELLAEIGAAGRATIRWNGRKWTVVIDRPRDVPVDHLSPRNASAISFTATYFEPPDAIRVPFLDASNDFRRGERIVPWPPDGTRATRMLLDADLDWRDAQRVEVTDDPDTENNVIWQKVGAPGAGSWIKASMDVIEEMQLPGKTDPLEVYVETRRRQYELIHRSVTWTATQDGAVRVATAGDLVMASRDLIRRVIHSARVVSVRGNLVTIDDAWTIEDGESYAIRFRVFDDEDQDDTIGESVVRAVATVPGDVRSVRLTGAGPKPKRGDIVHFGPAGRDSMPLIVASIERGKDNTSVFTLLPAAEIIDTLTDAVVPPAWDGRVGGEIDLSPFVPGAPDIVAIETGTAGTGISNGLRVLIADAMDGTIAAATFRLFHRLVGGGWSGPVIVPATEGATMLTSYPFGATVELYAVARSIAGTDGAAGATRTVTIGMADLPPVVTFDYAAPSKLPLLL